MFDKHKEGMISAYDLTQLLRWLKFNPTEREMKAYMEKYDKKKENRVTKDVAYAIIDQKVLEPDTIEELIEAMRLLDNTNTG